MCAMRNVVQRAGVAAMLALAIGACGDRTGSSNAPAARSDQSPIPAPAAAGPQPQADASGTPRAQATGPPDFTLLVGRKGPAVLDAVTKRTARGGSADLPDDPLFDFFRRFMPNPDQQGPESRAQGIGSGF